MGPEWRARAPGALRNFSQEKPVAWRAVSGSQVQASWESGVQVGAQGAWRGSARSKQLKNLSLQAAVCLKLSLKGNELAGWPFPRTETETVLAREAQ